MLLSVIFWNPVMLASESNGPACHTDLQIFRFFFGSVKFFGGCGGLPQQWIHTWTVQAPVVASKLNKPHILPNNCKWSRLNCIHLACKCMCVRVCVWGCSCCIYRRRRRKAKLHTFLWTLLLTSLVSRAHSAYLHMSVLGICTTPRMARIFHTFPSHWGLLGLRMPSCTSGKFTSWTINKISKSTSQTTDSPNSTTWNIHSISKYRKKKVDHGRILQAFFSSDYIYLLSSFIQSRQPQR